MTKDFQKIIWEALQNILKKNKITFNLWQKNIEVFQTQNDKFGDYTTNVLMILLKQKINLDPAEFLEELKKNDFIKEKVLQVEFVKPGFINFKLRQEVLFDNINNFLKINKKYFWLDSTQKYLIEHTSPNTNKALHVGHLRNNVYAMAVYRLLNLTNNKVTLDCVYNDRGIHVCKAIWGYLKKDHLVKPILEVIELYKKNSKTWSTPQTENITSDKFVEKCYKIGVDNEKEGENKKEMQWLLVQWENNHNIIKNIWKKLNNYVYSGFKKTYQTIGSVHHYNWYESNFYKQSKGLIKDGLTKGIFKKLEDGAVLSDLKNYYLTDTILQRSDGTAMYFTQDIYLTSKKVEKFKADKYVWVVGKEQELHFKQLFAICDQLNIGKINQFLHLSYGYIFWKDGKKMSSREGNVLSIDELILEAKDKVLALAKDYYKSLDQLAEKQKQEVSFKIALGAIKYALLKMDHKQDMFFDFNEILDVKSNGSPYIQYTYARINSMIKNNNQKINKSIKDNFVDLNKEESLVLRKAVYFKEELQKAAVNFDPHILINYLFELCKLYNGFYEKHKVLSNDKYQSQRILMSKAVFNIIKLSMELLGIEVIEKL